MFNQGITDSLIGAGLLDSARALAAQQQAEQENISFLNLLIRRQLVSSAALAPLIASRFGYPWLDLASTQKLPPDLLTTESGFDPAILRQHQILPLFANATHVTIAFSDPASLRAIDDLRISCGLQTEPVVVDHQLLLERLTEILDTNPRETIPSVSPDNESTDGSAVDNEVPVVTFVNRILSRAINDQVSDVHFEPYESRYRIRFRRDGVLHEASQAPGELTTRLNSRLKVLADLDITERRRPQDGRLQHKSADGRLVDMRISTLPTLWGEKIVLRIMNNQPGTLDPDELGFEGNQQEIYAATLARPQGMILVTGPTGSGKSITLYTALSGLNSAGRNIFTVEDPVEITQEGINQVAVNSAAGLDFSVALRAFLRQDPDVIMLGEIRDHETADIAVKAAQTGHLLLSTLHTNNAAETVTRLLNMGIPSYNLVGALSLIIAQRLCRRLCPHCKQSTQIDSDMLRNAGMSDEMISSAQLFTACGCHLCRKGYSGRTAIFEVIPISNDIANLIHAGAGANKIRAAADAAGHIRLRQSGLLKVARGETTLAEVERVC
tara:strand:- start:111536 stop:113197 length:1662 start_codon:yes stop_codon:yes gene_type:complete